MTRNTWSSKKCEAALRIIIVYIQEEMYDSSSIKMHEAIFTIEDILASITTQAQAIKNLVCMADYVPESDEIQRELNPLLKISL